MSENEKAPPLPPSNLEEKSKSPPLPRLPPPPPPLPLSPPPPPPLPPVRPTRRRIGKSNQQEGASIHYETPLRRSSTITIEKISAGLTSDPSFHSFSVPTAVAIGPYHHGSPQLSGMEAAKLSAVDDFFQNLTDKSREWVHQRLLLSTDRIRRCYVAGDGNLASMSDDELADMMLRDGCFVLLQLMNKVVATWPGNNTNSGGGQDGGESGRPPPRWTTDDDLVNSRMGAIARDVLLLENQIPWFVLQELMQLGGLDRTKAKAVVRKFLDRMATAFDVTAGGGGGGGGGHTSTNNKRWWWLWCRSRSWDEAEAQQDPEEVPVLEPQPDEEEGREVPASYHLLGLFHRHQLGKARTKAACIYILPSLGSTAVELAEMGVRLTASKTKVFGDMTMKKRCWPLGLFGELSLAPLVLNDLTACWLLNMVAYEAFLGATQADNFAVSSYLFLFAHLVNREEDVQDLRARGIISSAMSDGDTLLFFKSAAPSLRIGDRYIQISRRIQEYKQERWVWIAVHRFLYNNIKVIAALLSVAGVLVGLYKTILSLKQPHQ